MLPERLAAALGQPAVRRVLPALAGIGAMAAVSLAYLALAEGPQRVLYSTLSDAERAGVVTTLETGGISYDIDSATGMLSVAEDDVYRARMLVASEGSIASPDNTIELLDSIPLGSSRTLEGERLRNVRERELMRTIEEIDGVESVRVHLASPERSVFVRDNAPPSASVMLRMARGRSLTPDQVQAIVNLVAGSVPGLSADAVRVVDQSGRLLSDTGGNGATALELQREFEDKLRLQVGQLLLPMLGEGNFSTEVQVELDMSEVTQARESYDDQGAVRQERESTSTQGGEALAGGVPGVLANTPPPAAVLEEGAPEGTDPAAGAAPVNGARSTERAYEIGREVAVTSTSPGGVRRISVAVALSSEALAAIAPATEEQLQQLVSAAVGANADRGDQVTIVAGAFDPVEEVSEPFYEAGWFALALRYGIGLIVALLGLFFVVRPIMRALKPATPAESLSAAEGDDPETPVTGIESNEIPIQGRAAPSEGDLREQVELARRLASEQPDRAAAALRRMLAEPARG
ncbi:MAG: flagellar M-ring protein FliF [Erythrobacter sp.]|nr:MAG: flagellar M-ring protein FliF [Erythrobacter sp.]